MDLEVSLASVRNGELIQAIIVHTVESITKAHLEVTGSAEIDAADSMNALIMLLGSIIERSPLSSTPEGLSKLAQGVSDRLIECVRQGRVARESVMPSTAIN